MPQPLLLLPPPRTGPFRPGGHGPARGRCACGWRNVEQTNEAFDAHISREWRQLTTAGAGTVDLVVTGDLVRVPAYLVATVAALAWVNELGLRSTSLHLDGRDAFFAVPLWKWDDRMDRH